LPCCVAYYKKSLARLHARNAGEENSMRKSLAALSCAALLTGLLTPTLAGPPKDKPNKANGTKKEKFTKTKSGLEYYDVKVGKGPMPKMEQTVTVHYIGTFKNGKKFDASRDHGQPFSFQLGVDPVIKGWTEGLQTMRVGGTRKLIIPYQLAYGE